MSRCLIYRARQRTRVGPNCRASDDSIRSARLGRPRRHAARVSWVDLIWESQMTRRFLLLSAFILLSGIIGGAPRSVAAADPANFVGDLGTRALAATRSGDTAAVREGRSEERRVGKECRSRWS